MTIDYDTNNNDDFDLIAIASNSQNGLNMPIECTECNKDLLLSEQLNKFKFQCKSIFRFFLFFDL